MEFSDDQGHPEMNLEYSAYIYKSHCSYTDDEYIDINFRYAGWPLDYSSWSSRMTKITRKWT